VSIEVALTVQELAALKQLTKADDDAAAVTRAAREYLRLSRLRELKAASGRVEFELNWRELEDRELDAIGLPS
jgi:hypothetical protein